MGDVYHGNLHDISDLIATFQNMLTQQTSAAANTGSTASNTGNGPPAGSVNSKLLTAQKASQNMGFLSATYFPAPGGNLTTSSTTFVDVGVSVTNVPNGAKIFYNFWFCTDSAGGTAYFQLVAGSTVEDSASTTSVWNAAVQKKDYSGNIKNTSGATNTVKFQFAASTGHTTYAFNNGKGGGIVCANGAGATVIAGSVQNGAVVIGACQISSLAVAAIGTAQPPSLAIGLVALGTGNGSASYAYPVKQQYGSGVVFVTAAVWNDVDALTVIDFTGDLLTVN